MSALLPEHENDSGEPFWVLAEVLRPNCRDEAEVAVPSIAAWRGRVNLAPGRGGAFSTRRAKRKTWGSNATNLRSSGFGCLRTRRGVRRRRAKQWRPSAKSEIPAIS